MSNSLLQKQARYNRRKLRTRAKVQGTSECPRLSVFRSNKYVWAQLIDDASSKTLVSANDREMASKKKTSEVNRRQIQAEAVGNMIAEKAKEKKIIKVVFDRGGYKYHGIVKAVAEGARKGGLTF